MENQKEFVETLFNKKDRKKLWVPPTITNKEIDLEKEQVVAWIHPSGHIGYVFYNNGVTPIAFMMDRSNPKSKSNKVCMCAWCLSVKSLSKMAMFSRQISDNNTLSLCLCSDLNCLSSIKDINPNTMPETITREQKEQRYLENLEDYIINYVQRR